MKDWCYGINSLYKEASVYLKEAPWYIWFLNWLFNLVCAFLTSMDIPLPDIKIPTFDKETIEYNDGCRWVSLKAWYGDFGQWFHCIIHDPILHFCRRRTKTKHIGMDYDKLRKLVYSNDKKFWDEEEKSARETIKEEGEEQIKKWKQEMEKDR